MLGASKRRVKIKFKLGRSPTAPPGSVHRDKRRKTRSQERIAVRGEYGF